MTGEVTETYRQTRETKVRSDDTLEVLEGNLMIDVKTGFRRSLIKTQDVTNVEGSLWSVGVPEGQMLQSCKGPWTVGVSEGAAKITAHEAIEIKAETGEIKIEAPLSDVIIKAINIESKASGKWKWEFLGDAVGLTVGATSETLIGGKNENIIGLKAEMLVGGKIEIMVGPVFEHSVLGMKHGILGIETAALKEHNAALELDNKLTKIQEGATHITMNTLNLTTVALFMVT